MLDFTKNEQRVVLFLCAGFFSGLCVWIYREHFQPLPDIKAERPRIFAGSTEVVPSEDSTKIQYPNNQGAFNNENRKININHASYDDLTQLPGIGEVMAKRIVEYRNQHGSFQHAQALMKVKGIGPKTIKNLEEYIIIDSIEEE